MTGHDAPPPKLLRPIEVRRLLNLGRTTIHDHTVSGRLVAETTLGGHRRYPADQPALRAAQEALTAQQPCVCGTPGDGYLLTRAECRRHGAK